MDGMERTLTDKFWSGPHCWWFSHLPGNRGTCSRHFMEFRKDEH